MKWGKTIVENYRNLPYADRFLTYKSLKKQIRDIKDSSSFDRQLKEQQFIVLLLSEVEKINEFWADQEEDAVIQWKILEDKLGSPRHDRSAMKRSLVEFHAAVIALEEYAALNFTSLVKIVKKLRKHGGLNLLDALPDLFEQPFYSSPCLDYLISRIHDEFRRLHVDASPSDIYLTADPGLSHSTDTISLQDLIDATEAASISPNRSVRSLRLLQRIAENMLETEVLGLLQWTCEGRNDSPGIAHTVILSSPFVHVSVWRIPSGVSVPCHDSGKSIIISRLLQGSCQLRSYAWKNLPAERSETGPRRCQSEIFGPMSKKPRLNFEGCCSSLHEPEVPSGAVREAVPVGDFILCDALPTCLTSPSNSSNLRSLASLEDTILLDITIPEHPASASPRLGRLHWYGPIPQAVPKGCPTDCTSLPQPHQPSHPQHDTSTSDSSSPLSPCGTSPLPRLEIDVDVAVPTVMTSTADPLDDSFSPCCLAPSTPPPTRKRKALKSSSAQLRYLLRKVDCPSSVSSQPSAFLGEVSSSLLHLCCDGSPAELHGLPG